MLPRIEKKKLRAGLLVGLAFLEFEASGPVELQVDLPPLHKDGFDLDPSQTRWYGKHYSLPALLSTCFDVIEVQNVIRSQTHRNEKGPTRGNEKGRSFSP